MKIEYYIADPAGNITVLVTTGIPKDKYSLVAEKFLGIPEIKAEQVGYIVQPQKISSHTRLEMMGGEFCGNAMRSAAFLYAMRAQFTNKSTVLTEVSGSAEPHRVYTDVSCGEAFAEMPLPMAVEKYVSDGINGKLCLFEGIGHIICNQNPEDFSLNELKNSLKRICAEKEVSAAGIMFLHDMKMSPLVFVKDTDSIIFENSCASGSSAAAVCTCGHSDGVYKSDFIQPGGVIHTEVTMDNGEVKKILLGGKVLIGEKQEIELDF